MKKILLMAMVLSINIIIKAQDVQLILPKLSIENSIKTFLDARGASFSSYTPGFGVDMWNVKLIYSDSYPLVLDLIPPNRFRIQCGIIARANINYIAGSFDVNGEGDITVEGVLSTEGSLGQITLYGSAEAVVHISNGMPSFLLGLISSGEFVIRIPEFELATFVYTLPYIPLNYFTTNYPTINITNDNVILGLQTPNNFLIVDQRAENGNRIVGSQIGHWSSSAFQNYTVPKVFSNLPLNTNQTFRGSQELLLNPSQKYNRWNNLGDVLSHQTFFLTGNFSRLNSNFKLTHSGVTIKNAIEGTNITGGTLFF